MTFREPRFWRWVSAVALGTYLALSFFAGDQDPDAKEKEDRTFHPVTVAQLPTTKWTHIRVCGTATLVKQEADGDLHIRVSDGLKFIVAETVPYHPLKAPKKGQRLCVSGISRYDKAHLWFEVHPVEVIEFVK